MAKALPHPALLAGRGSGGHGNFRSGSASNTEPSDPSKPLANTHPRRPAARSAHVQGMSPEILLNKAKTKNNNQQAIEDWLNGNGGKVMALAMIALASSSWSPFPALVTTGQVASIAFSSKH